LQLDRHKTDVKLLHSTDSFKRQLETCLYESVYMDSRLIYLCDVSGHNTNALVSVTVTWQEPIVDTH